jgi:hypothetical protein
VAARVGAPVANAAATSKAVAPAARAPRGPAPLGPPIAMPRPARREASATPAAPTAASADATYDGPPAAPLAAPSDAASDGADEATWFDARRDLAPEGASIATAESPDLIRFDAERFHAIARGGERRPWWVTTLYALGATALALALLAQAVHHWRDDLAQHPIAGPPIREAYARLGLALEPQWNLAAYEVKQWGATSDVQPGTLRVRASIVNRAARAQPHPLLRVTLLDRFSAKVARREFAAAEYLPGRTEPATLLAPGARVDADVVIADPGSEAVGFELDVCLRRQGVLTCAAELRIAAPDAAAP